MRKLTVALICTLICAIFAGCGQAAVRLSYAGGEEYSSSAVTSGGNETAVEDEYARYAALNDTGYKYQLGIEVKRDYEKAAECYRAAAEHGIPEAITNLGYCYERGLGVEQDYARAFALYSKAAELGEYTAINNLGWCYEQGLGVEQDYDKAYELYSRAAEGGNSLAYENMRYLEEAGLVK